MTPVTRLRTVGGGYWNHCVWNLSRWSLLKHSLLCNQTWYCGASLSWTGVSCRKTGLQSSRSRLLWGLIIQTKLGLFLLPSGLLILLQPSSVWLYIVVNCYWSLFFLYSAILRFRADSLHPHVILHEWIAFYSAFLNIHRSGVLTALAWLVPHETAAILARSVYSIQPCTMSLHAKPHT